MPGTGATFLIGAAAISGLPPLNGFISEFLIYLASFKGAVSLDASSSVPMLATISGLALIGGLAAACFTKAFGIVFLGHPRTEDAEEAHEVGTRDAGARIHPGGWMHRDRSVRFRALCDRWRPLISTVTGLSLIPVGQNLAEAANSVARVGYFGAVLIGLATLLSLARSDCAFAAPSRHRRDLGLRVREPLAADAVHGIVVRSTAHGDFCRVPADASNLSPRLEEFFPQAAEFHTHTDDPYQSYIFRPLFRAISRGMTYLRPLQQGKVQLYVLYIAITLLALLLWQIVLNHAFGIDTSAHSGGNACSAHAGCNHSDKVRRWRAAWASRLLQPYRDLWKLLRKGAVYSNTTTWIFRMGPAGRSRVRHSRHGTPSLRRTFRRFRRSRATLS